MDLSTPSWPPDQGVGSLSECVLTAGTTGNNGILGVTGGPGMRTCRKATGGKSARITARSRHMRTLIVKRRILQTSESIHVGNRTGGRPGSPCPHRPWKSVRLFKIECVCPSFLRSHFGLRVSAGIYSDAFATTVPPTSFRTTVELLALTGVDLDHTIAPLAALPRGCACRGNTCHRDGIQRV